MGGLSVGFIGTATEDIPSLVSPSGISSLSIRLEQGSQPCCYPAQRRRRRQRRSRRDCVVETHNGSANAECPSIAAEDTAYGDLLHKASGKIDAIFSGHTHNSYDCSIAGPSGERPVIQSHQYGSTLGKVSLDVDPATGEVLKSSSERLPLATEDSEETGRQTTRRIQLWRRL